MIRVLLADDNKMSLQYFSELIRWEDYGYQLIATAVDGEDAWNLFQDHHPEVVIADIQMPVMSGIKLAEKILHIAPDTVFLFLSSYKEFHYAHAALKLKVYDYLLKHETTERTLIQKLTDIRAHLDWENKKRQLLAKENISRIFLCKEEKTVVSDPDALFLKETYDCFFIEQEHPFPFISQILKEYPLVGKTSLKKTLNEHSVEHISSLVHLIAVSEYQYILITPPCENPFDFCCQLQEELKNNGSPIYSVVILQKNRSIKECAGFYKDIAGILSQIYFYPPASIIEGSYLKPQNAYTFPEAFGQQYSPLHHDLLPIMDQQFKAIAALKDYSAFCYIADKWLKILLSYDRHIVDPATGHIVSLFSEHDTPASCDVMAVYRFVRKKFTVLTDILSLCRVPEFSPLIREAVFIISMHYSNYDLTVDWIAKKMKISSSSLNALFKKETGYTPWKVIINTRLLHAHRLIEQGFAPHDVYVQVGYNSLSYFSKAFKKAYGISPQQYKRGQEHET